MNGWLLDTVLEAVARAAEDSVSRASRVLLLVEEDLFALLNFCSNMVQVAKWDEQREAGFFPGPL